MEFTPTMFAELLRGIITLDNSYRSAINADWKVKNKRQTAEKKENKQLSNGNKQSFSSCGSDMVKALNDTAELSRFATNQYLNEKDGVLSELAVTNEKISLLEHMLSQLRTSQADAEETDSPYRHLESIEDLMTQSYYITPLTASASDEECRKFGQQCRAELSRLRRSAQRLRWELLDTKKLQGSYSRNIEKLDQQLKDCCKRQMDRLDVCTYSYARGLRELRQKKRTGMQQQQYNPQKPHGSGLRHFSQAVPSPGYDEGTEPDLFQGTCLSAVPLLQGDARRFLYLHHGLSPVQAGALRRDTVLSEFALPLPDPE